MEASQAQLASPPELNGGDPMNEQPPDEVESAKGEVVDEAKMVDFHGLALTLPPSLPASMMFDMTEAEVDGDDSITGSAAVHAVFRAVGKDQWRKAKRHAEDLNLTVDDFSDFVNSVFKAYGMGSGESSEPSPSPDGGGGS